MKKPSQILESEHRIIEKMLGAMARLTEMLETNRTVSSADIAAMVEFMRTLAHTAGDTPDKVDVSKLTEVAAALNTFIRSLEAET